MHPREFMPEALPWSPEAETSVLGALMLESTAWDSVGDLLTSEHFFDARNGRIFTAVAGLVAASKPADIVTVFDQLQASASGEGVDLAMLDQIAQFVPSAGNLRRYAEIVAERALMRSLIRAADEVKSIAGDTSVPVESRLDKAQGLLQALQVKKSRQMPTVIADTIVGLLDRVERLADGTAVPGIPTGIPSLDRMLGGGFKPGKQVIIAARPSVGKSSLAEQLCINLARAGHPAAMFSQEMSKEELTERAVANIGRIAMDRLLSGQLEQHEWSRMTESMEVMRNLPLYLDDQPALTLSDISAKARMLKRQHGIKLIAIDYLQLCAAGKATDSRHHQIEEMSRGLKNLARQLDITIVTLSQLNREVEKRTSGRPILSDLKESGAIEEDADVVILLSCYSANPEGANVIACDVPKNRQGRVGELALSFEGRYQLWQESSAPLQVRKTASGKRYTDEA
ncbi:replicative DNA helicase [Polaromonas glacialis]|uniref:replicative DNA helicase n=1 Tax=Polaromonas glacialis TaxID=866564 RepID=UPI000690057A|nr:replicative DNA helicase [Polaromonas glacialis]